MCVTWHLHHKVHWNMPGCVLECAMDAPWGAWEHPKHVLGRSERQHPVRKKLPGCKCLVSTAG